MKTKGKIYKKCIHIFLCAIILSTSAFALTPPLTSSNSLRDQIAQNWEFKEQGWKENNCLGWALGETTQWVWPWEPNNPSVDQVDVYMAYRGYTAGNYNISQAIYAYGTTNNVTHFARGRGYGPLAKPIDAKWGKYEVFIHTSTSPYNSIPSGSYGSLVRSYN